MNGSRKIGYGLSVVACVLLTACGNTQPTPGVRGDVAVVDVGNLSSPDCWYEIGVRDLDGEPGGEKVTILSEHCP